ncbi:Acetyl-coenzyme A synthetase [Pigmentiphaga humi]|uniref:Acetyl-coenzyme A synthetase n=1 Tax=Pigmentiphaga humi TaxID=2478468 RepID=A0A3P4BA21_9BURK|nr:AMP-binding protein [Pigmentiphaga humi]VCU72578.1 Acetyl-coenzyme A synthetase [Pigmentiphaga humi]
MEDQYEALYTTFRWWVPQRLNIADLCCRRWTAASADARRLAIYAEDASGRREIWTYGRLQEYANRLSNGLRRMGVQRGDRVAIALPQRPEAVVAHIAAYQMGAITVPLSVQLNTQTYEQRLRDSEARIAIVDGSAAAALLPATEHCPLLRQAVGIDLDSDARVLSWRTLLARQESAFEMHPTSASDPALLLYTSGSSGAPKGVVLPHAALIGNLPGFVASQNWFPQPADILWTSSEWGSPHGLFGGVLPTLYFGQPLVGTRERLAPAQAFALLERYQVTNLALTSRELRRLLKADPCPSASHRLAVRSLAVTDTALGAALFERCQTAFGVAPNETFSQVEIGTVIGQSSEKWPVRAGSMGRPYPGHQIAIVDAHGQPVDTGMTGEIAVNRYDINGHSDPSFFAGYWRGEETGRPVNSTWHRTGDLARMDEEGYLWHLGRIDEMFQVGGQLVAPGPIEDSLRQHPEVDEAVILPVPDGSGIKAYIVRSVAPQHAAEPVQESPAVEGAESAPSPADVPADAEQSPEPDAPVTPASPEAATVHQETLAAQLDTLLADIPGQHHVEFVDALPLTPSGKIRRQAFKQIEEERQRKWPPAPANAAPLP